PNCAPQARQRACGLHPGYEFSRPERSVRRSLHDGAHAFDDVHGVVSDPLIHADRLPGLGNDFTASRICSMKRSTTGFKVRFFSVRIATGHGRTGKSTDNILKALTCTHELGKAVMYPPLASNRPTT